MQNMPSRFLESFRLERKRASSGLSVPELERWTNHHEPLGGGRVHLDVVAASHRGDSAQLHLHVASSGDSIEVQAVVVSTNSGHKLDAAATGMGLRFSRMSSEIVEEVHGLYERELERAAHELKGAGSRLRSAS